MSKWLDELWYIGRALWRVVRGMVSEAGAAPAEAETPVSNVRAQTFNTLPHFSAIVDELRREVRPGQPVALSGMPGCGKTFAACEWAHRLRDEEDLDTFFVLADTAENLDLNLAALALLVIPDLPESYVPESPEEFEDEHVKRVLDALAARRGWSIVFDNMDGYFHEPARFPKMEGYLQRLQCGRVLITTRDTPMAIRRQHLTVVPMEVLSPEEGGEFLLEQAGLDRGDPELQKEAQEISRQLGGLPLAVDQAAAYILSRIEEDGQYSLRRFAEEHQHNRERYWRHLEAEQGAAGRAVGDEDGQSDYRHPVYGTFVTAFNRLRSDRPDEVIAADLLRLCAHLEPVEIPIELLELWLEPAAPNEEAQDGSQPGSRILAAIDHARKLRLLDHDFQNQTVQLHRTVHTVLRDLVALEEAGTEDWREKVLQLLARGLERPRLVPHLHPHLAALQRTAESAGSKKTYPQDVQAYLDRLIVLEALRDGGSWELLLGGESPSYRDLHRLEDPEELKQVQRMMAAISHVCSEEYARVVFLCVYLVVHYWWDCYLEGDRLADPLLDLWAATHDHEKDQKLVEALRTIQLKYPPVNHYRERTQEPMVPQWNACGDALRRVRAQLGLDTPPAGRETSAYRYARGMSGMYLAEALRYARNVEGYQFPDSPEALKLYQEALALFRANADTFHENWAQWEIAAFAVEAAQRCRAYATHRPRSGRMSLEAERYFDLARTHAQEGLAFAIRRAEDDDIDGEVIANFYTTHADLEWVATRDPARVAGYRFAAAFTAYGHVLSEEDAYSVALYGEHVDRLLKWLQQVKLEDAAAAHAICQFFRRCWGRPRLFEGTLRGLLASELPEAEERLRAELVPADPELEVSDPTDPGERFGASLTHAAQEEVRRILRTMPERLPRLQDYPLPSDLQQVAELMRAQLAEDNEAEGEIS